MELEKLNSKQLGAQQKTKDVADAAKLVVCYVPKVTIVTIDKEILVITQIKTKITDFCASALRKSSKKDANSLDVYHVPVVYCS